jgi:hypothetical protein
MMNACGGEGAWQTNWQGQLDFLISEAETKPYLKKSFTDAQEASKWFTEYWERPNKAKEKAESRLGNLKKRFSNLIGK